MWSDDEDFVAWLDENDLGNDNNPLSDETLELMYQAWDAGYDLALEREGIKL